MAAFVLVHGSGQNARSWDRVAERLRGRGHTVAAPELPKRAPGWGLADYAAEIGKAVTRPGVVLVAHSLSGVFLPLVPRVEECELLVFLAAVVPAPGKSVRDQFTEDPTMFSPAWIEAGARWFDRTQQESVAREFLFHDCDDRALPWALSTVEPLETRALVTEPSPMQAQPNVPMAAIVAKRDRTLSPDWCRRVGRRAAGSEPLEIDAGHCPHQSRPDGAADLLERLALRASDRRGDRR